MKIRNWLFGCILLLAIVGLGSSVLTHPGALIKQLIIGAFVIAAIYMVYRLVSDRKPNGKDKRAFIKAARKSKRRLKKRHVVSSAHTQARKKPIRKKSDVQLTVIEGKKGKKKNRAMF